MNNNDAHTAMGATNDCKGRSTNRSASAFPTTAPLRNDSTTISIARPSSAFSATLVTLPVMWETTVFEPSTAPAFTMPAPKVKRIQLAM